jgi:hypothetical protein
MNAREVETAHVGRCGVTRERPNFGLGGNQPKRTRDLVEK